MIKRVLITTLLPLIGLVAACSSQRPANKGSSAAVAGDADGDGAISRAEFDLAVNPWWNRIDGDQDEVVTQAEMARAFERYDADGNGQLDSTEAPGLMMPGQRGGL